jgi:uncharacterized protein YyaL (SSP411 family)
VVNAGIFVRVSPIPHYLFEGCHVTRDIPSLITSGGFQIVQIETAYQITHDSFAGDPVSQDTREMLRQVSTRFLPNKILLLADGGTGQQQLARWLPFVAGAHRMKDRATAYVCENYVCKMPTTDPQMMARLLENRN